MKAEEDIRTLLSHSATFFEISLPLNQGFTILSRVADHHSTVISFSLLFLYSIKDLRDLCFMSSGRVWHKLSIYPPKDGQTPLP